MHARLHNVVRKLDSVHAPPIESKKDWSRKEDLHSPHNPPRRKDPLQPSLSQTPRYLALLSRARRLEGQGGTTGLLLSAQLEAVSVGIE